LHSPPERTPGATAPSFLWDRPPILHTIRSAPVPVASVVAGTFGQARRGHPAAFLASVESELKLSPRRLCLEKCAVLFFGPGRCPCSQCKTPDRTSGPPLFGPHDPSQVLTMTPRPGVKLGKVVVRCAPVLF